jgi:glyoxylase-like metal-dependent hydrolase (beta-lactamase superfamily II)
MSKNTMKEWVDSSDIIPLRTFIANVFFIGKTSVRGDFVLVDAGTLFSSSLILKTAEKLYGRGSQPRAIVLTHGHFDHTGALSRLLKVWSVPVYAHELELPYLTGMKNYMRPDPTVGGGIMSLLSPVYPHRGMNISNHVKPLPGDNRIPELPEWRWIHTPGHTDGHISLFRDKDRALISGDAFITVKQESLLSVLTERPEPHGPPAYFTTDWRAAKRSVEKIHALHPSVVFPGHGMSVDGEVLSQFLDRLVQEFDQIAIPKHGRYVSQ